MAPPCRLIHKLGAISSFPFEGALSTLSGANRILSSFPGLAPNKSGFSLSTFLSLKGIFFKEFEILVINYLSNPHFYCRICKRLER